MNKRILSPEQKEKIFEELLEYFKRSNKNQFGYEQDKLISYEEAQIILDKLNKQKEVLDKIKEHLLNYIEEWQDSEDEYVKGKIDLARDVLCDIEELLEEIE